MPRHSTWRRRHGSGRREVGHQSRGHRKADHLAHGPQGAPNPVDLAFARPLFSPLKPCPRLPDVTHVSRPTCHPGLQSVTQIAALAPPETPAKTTLGVNYVSAPFTPPFPIALPSEITTTRLHHAPF